MRTATLTLASLAALSAACGRGGHDQAVVRNEIAVAVVTTATTVRERSEILEAGGIVRGRTSATIASRMMAPVRDVLVRPGDRVRAGQLLVRLDDRDVAAAVRQADARALASERGADAARAERNGAQTTLVLARVTHGRIATLHERRSATPEELDQAVAALRAAEARLARATAAVDEAQANLDGARAGGDAASVEAGFARIVAPFDGVVTEKLVDPGNLVTPGTPLVRIEDTRGFELEVRLDESRAAWIRRDMALAVLVDGPTGGVELPGRVFDVARAIDADTRTSLVTITLPSDPALRSGTFGRALIPGPLRRALAIPERAIVRHGQLTNVFVTRQDRARLRLVRVGRTTGRFTEVLAGLSEGEVVVIDPPPSLRDGATVRAQSAAAWVVEGGRS